MWKASLQSVLITVIITALNASIGFVYGKWFLSEKNQSYFDNGALPEGLMDYKSFVTVGFIHNFSYLGGLLGLVVGVVWQLKVKRMTDQGPERMGK